MSLQMVARGQTMNVLDSLGLPHPTTAKSIRYWIDDDAGSVKTTTAMDGLHSVDVSSVLEGLHTIHYQIIDSENNVCAPYSEIFLALSKNVQSNESSLRYWFDDDTKVMTCSANAGVQTLDASMLLDGLHIIHYQVIDKEGKASYIASNIFMKMGTGAISANASTLRYWFDDDNTKVMTCSANAGVQTLDVSNLLDGLHTLHYQVIDKEGKLSYIASNIFMKMGGNGTTDKVTASKLIYWFDDDENTNTVNMSNGMQMLDASALLDGLHTVHYQVVCSDGTITSAYSAIFMRMSVSSESSAAKSIRYWFDDEQEATDIAITNGIQTLDASHLLDGLHTVHYQLIDDKGFSATPMSSIFLKTTVGVATTAQKLRYWFDDNSDVKTTDVAGGTQSIDVSGLLTGLHTLHYQLVDDQGYVCAPVSGLFLKQYDKIVESGENVITQYMYWMNENSADNKKVKVDNPSSPYQLITLLPMIKAPIRSSSFHFEAKDGEPTIYAKNDLHIRFEDAAGYWVDDARSFVDYSVSEAVTDADVLKNIQTFTRPEENGIKWFKFEAAPGDTIAFKSSQATSIQVFAPSGEEIYSASGDKSVKYGGAHTWENGTYYVAVHDVTGSKTSVTLDYMHMDKYDVVSQDVRVVGNGGCSTITFQGNGFKDLYAVDLKDSKGNIIVSENIGHESDSKTSVRFNFTNVPIGTYNAIFRFTEEDKVINSLVNIEEAKEIGIQLKTSYASTFLRGTANTYTIRVTNTGNSTAYQVPLKIQLQADGGIRDIISIKMSDNIPVMIPTFMEEDTVPQNVKDEIRQIIDSYDGMLHFMKFRDASGDEFLEGYFALDLSPNSTYELSVSVKSNSRIVLFSQIPSSWFFYTYEENGGQNAARRVFRKSTFRDNACCSRDHVECIVDVLVNGLDFASLGFPNLSLASCLASIGNTVFKTSYDVWCGEAPNKDAFSTASFISGLVATAASCLPDRLDPQKWGAAYRFFYDIFSTGFSCATTLNPNITPDFPCPPDPPKPHPSNPVNSLDPNDIYGYIAPSGTKFVGKDVVSMPYRIEFENDTTFATASAHTVVVKDTLDAKVFDLSSYQPTCIKIGDKSVQLKGDKEFVTTVDMRPAINAIAQVEGLYDEKKGIATWQFTSLDPMTMEPTDDIMQGFLPVNYDGSGIGEVAYNINRKAGLSDGVEIDNKASIVFDHNDAIATPVWTNIIDAIPPVSEVGSLEQMNDSIVRIHFDGYDNRSDIWKYSLYVQYGEGSTWNEVAEMDSAYYDFRFYEDIDYGFCVLATDSAGNVEQKIIQREYMFLNGKTEKIDAITVPVDKKRIAVTKAYDLSGRVVQEEGYRGIIIKNRKKIQKR